MARRRLDLWLVKNRGKILLALVFLIAFGLRFYHLNINPPGLYVDEVSIGYNAYSILKTGYDEHGQFFPLWFQAFGEYKLPVYIYLTAIAELIFGVNELAVRFPSAFFGFLTVVAYYFLVKELLPRFSLDKYIFAASLLAVSPWHLHFSRAGFEANLALFFVTLATLLFVLAIKKKKLSLMLLSLINFVLSFYTYNAYRLFTPLLIVALFAIYRKQLKKFVFRQLILVLILAVLISLPFLKFSFSPEGLVRAQAESFFSQVEVSGEAPLFSRTYLYLTQFFKNYLSYFSFDFLFFAGDQNGRHSVRKMGELYLWQLPFLLVGFYLLLRKGDKQRAYFKKIAASWLFLSPLAASFTKVNPHALRALMMVIPLQSIIFLGFLAFFQAIKKKLWRRGILFLVLLLAFYNLAGYLHLYWVHYPQKTFIDWAYGYKQLFAATGSLENRYEKIVINNHRRRETYLFFLFYQKYDPWKNLASQTNDSFPPYYFTEGFPLDLGKGKGKFLYAALAHEELPPEGLLKEIRYPDGGIVYRLYEPK